MVNRSRGTQGNLESISDSKQRIIELCMAGAASATKPEAIERYERGLKQIVDRERLEAYDRAAQAARKLVPVPRMTQDMVIKHYRPHASGPVLKRTTPLLALKQWESVFDSEGRTVCAIIGKMGTGKTTAAMAAALKALLRGEAVVYVKEPTLVRWRKYVSLDEHMGRAMCAGLLIIDELGTETKHIEEASSAILEAVDDRLAVGRTMLIGNLTRAEFRARYDDRLTDRLREVGVVNECDGDSLRGSARVAGGVQ